MSSSEADRDIRIDSKRAYRVVSKWTDEESAHRVLEEIAEASGIRRDALSIEEREIEVDSDA